MLFNSRGRYLGVHNSLLWLHDIAPVFFFVFLTWGFLQKETNVFFYCIF